MKILIIAAAIILTFTANAQNRSRSFFEGIDDQQRYDQRRAENNREEERAARDRQRYEQDKQRYEQDKAMQEELHNLRMHKRCIELGWRSFDLNTRKCAV